MSPKRAVLLNGIWSTISDNLGTKIISLIIACVLWVIVLGSRNVEIVKEVPLEVITSSDIMPSNEIPDRVSFRLSGPKAFLRAVLDRRDEPIQVNLAGAKPQVITYRFFSDNIHVPIGVKVLSINPAMIPIKLEHVKRRQVPVKVEVRGEPPEGYRLVGTRVTPESVQVRGAETRVDTLAQVTTLPIDISSLKQTTETEVPLDLSRYNVQVEGALPRVTVQIEPSTANYRIRNVEVRVTAERSFKLEDKTVTVLVRALPKNLRSLDRAHVYATLDLSGSPQGHYAEPVHVVLPDSITLVKVIPEKVRVTVY